MIVTKPNVLDGNLRLGARDNFHDACGDGTVGVSCRSLQEALYPRMDICCITTS